MKKILVLLFAFTVIIACYSCGGGSGKVLAEVNGSKITEGDIDFLGNINPRIKSQLANPAGKKRVLDNLVEQDLLYQEALKKGINRDSKVKAKIDLYRKVIIAQSLIEDEQEKDAEKYYKDHPEEFKKLKISHITVKYATPDEMKKMKGKGKKPAEPMRSEEEALKIAKELKGRIDKGEDFAKVAGDKSDDAATKARGGDLGLISKDDKRLSSRGLGELSAKAFEMKVGDVSEPIKTPKGYEIITVTRGVELEPFEEAKQEIAFKARSNFKDEFLGKLKKDAKISYPEEEKQKAEAKKRSEEAKKSAEAKKEEKPAGAEGAAVAPVVDTTAPQAEKPAQPVATDAPKQPEKK